MLSLKLHQFNWLRVGNEIVKCLLWENYDCSNVYWIAMHKVSLCFLTSWSCRGFWCSHGKRKLHLCTVYPKKYAHGFCFAVLCCGYTLTDFPMYVLWWRSRYKGNSADAVVAISFALLLHTTVLTRLHRHNHHQDNNVDLATDNWFDIYQFHVKYNLTLSCSIYFKNHS